MSKSEIAGRVAGRPSVGTPSAGKIVDAVFEAVVGMAPARVQNKSDVVVHGPKHIFKVFANCLPVGRTTLLSAYRQSNRNPQVGDFREAWVGAGDGK